MNKLISDAEEFIRALFQNEFSGHDYFHSMRVCKTAVRIAEAEGADPEETALIALLRDGKSGETYTAVGDDCSLRIRELAQTVSDTLTGGACRVRFDIPENTANLPYAPDTEMRLSNAKLKSLGWKPAFGIKDAIRSLAKDLDELSAEVR